MSPPVHSSFDCRLQSAIGKVSVGNEALPTKSTDSILVLAIARFLPPLIEEGHLIFEASWSFESFLVPGRRRRIYE